MYVDTNLINSFNIYIQKLEDTYEEYKNKF